MNNWIIETTENFDEKGFYIIAEHLEKHQFVDFKVSNKEEYENMSELEEMIEQSEIDLLSHICEIRVKKYYYGSHIVYVPKSKLGLVSCNEIPPQIHLGIVIKVDADLDDYSRSKGKVDEAKEFPFS